MKHFIVIGGNAGGASVAARLRRLDEHAQITIFEKGKYISFSNCSLPYTLSNVLDDPEDVVLLTPKELKQQYNIDAVVNTEAINIVKNRQQVVVRNLDSGKETTENYDALFLSTGAKPIKPSSIKGIDNVNVFTVHDVQDTSELEHFLEDKSKHNITIIGAGFVGLEVSVNLQLSGYQVTIVEKTSHVLKTLDDDFAQILHKQLIDNGVNLIVNDSVSEIDAGNVILKSGKIIETDAVVVAIGVQPEVSLAKKVGIEIGETGAIKVDKHYQTNILNIYAVGDAIEVTNKLTYKQTRLNLAYLTQIQARAAADHVYGRSTPYFSVIGSQVIKIFGLNAASTGLTEEQSTEAGIEHRSVTIIPKDKVPLMPSANPLFFKVIFQYPTGKILGSQAIGYSEVDKQINVIATAIHFGGTVEDLPQLELSYQPEFSTAKNAVNMAGLVAENILNGEFEQVPVSSVRGLVEDHALIIDARESSEYAEGHIQNAINIPLSEFRKRLDEIPSNRPVYIHCLSSQRSYNMVRALKNLGYNNVYNIVGSFLGLSEYEFYHDQTDDRTPIVNNYRFDLL